MRRYRNAEVSTSFDASRPPSAGRKAVSACNVTLISAEPAHAPNITCLSAHLHDLNEPRSAPQCGCHSC